MVLQNNTNQRPTFVIEPKATACCMTCILMHVSSSHKPSRCRCPSRCRSPPWCWLTPSWLKGTKPSTDYPPEHTHTIMKTFYYYWLFLSKTRAVCVSVALCVSGTLLKLQSLLPLISPAVISHTQRWELSWGSPASCSRWGHINGRNMSP